MAEIFASKDPFDHLMIENVFGQIEVDNIFDELMLLFPKFVGPEFTKSASKDGRTLKKNLGIFLDKLSRSQLENSNILKYMLNVLQNQQMQTFAINQLGYYFKLLSIINDSSTLVQYYENGDYYKPHNDRSVLTAVYTLYREPKNFEGGDFHFSEYDYTVPLKNNKMIIFPSTILHSVKQIKMSPNYQNQHFGRFSIANLLYVKP